MTKAEIIAAIAEEAGLKKGEAEAFLAAQALVVRAVLKRGGDLTIPNVGKLSAAQREAREARNPATGATIQVPAKSVVKFKVAKDLADAVA